MVNHTQCSLLGWLLSDVSRFCIWCLFRSCSWQGTVFRKKFWMCFWNLNFFFNVLWFAFLVMQLMVAATLVLLCSKPPEIAMFEHFPWLLPVPAIAIIGREVFLHSYSFTMALFKGYVMWSNYLLDILFVLLMRLIVESLLAYNSSECFLNQPWYWFISLPVFVIANCTVCFGSLVLCYR